MLNEDSSRGRVVILIWNPMPTLLHKALPPLALAVAHMNSDWRTEKQIEHSRPVYAASLATVFRPRSDGRIPSMS